MKKFPIANKHDFGFLNIDVDFISGEGIAPIKDVLRKDIKGISMLGSSGDNYKEGGFYDEECEDNDRDENGQESIDSENELKKKLENLKM